MRSDRIWYWAAFVGICLLAYVVTFFFVDLLRESGIPVSEYMRGLLTGTSSLCAVLYVLRD